MKLKKLELKGFKSFPDQVELDFDSGITGVVGPNGSGKSNISDAVRWVLGEQSPKSIRGTKMEDVIFNGTEVRKKAAWCEVTLTFDNSDNSMNLPYNEIAVTRRVYRSGEGEYFINKSACRLKDIIDMFRDTGIGKEGYSLIGQGRIDEILSVKSEDRRAVFEEAAGIARFKARKQEAEHRLENTRGNLSRVEDIISELEKRIEPLKAQSAAAREYLELADELKGLELNTFLTRTERYNTRIKELTESLAALESAIASLDGEIDSLTKQRDEANIDLSIQETAAAEKRETVQTLIRDTEACEGACGILRERLAASEKERSRLSELICGAKAANEKESTRLNDLKIRLHDEKEEAELAEVKLTNAQSELSSLMEKLTKGEADVESLKEKRIASLNRLSDVKSEQARYSAMHDALTGRLEELKKNASVKETETEACRTEIAAIEETLAAQKAEVKHSDDAISAIQKELNDAGLQIEIKTQSARQLTAKQHDVLGRLKVLEEMQRDYEGYQNSVKQVLLQARRLPNSGVHGVIATLINVPGKLERAIDMVLGGALQNIVVDREENAKVMIDYLRQGRLGRATFLPISSVHGKTLTPQERSVLKMEGCVGLASELITFDPKYKGIIDSLLGRTVIAENLDCGIRIQRAGNHAFRLVTLEGDVMHSGGSMTGGSVTSRVTSLLSREREINENRELAQKLTQEIAQAQAEADALEQSRNLTKQKRTEAYDTLHRQEIEVAHTESELTGAREALRECSEDAKRIQDETERTQQQLCDVDEALEKLAHTTTDTNAGDEDTQHQIDLMNQEISSLKSEITVRQKSVTEQSAAQAARKRGLTALEDEIGRSEKETGSAAEALRINEQFLESCNASLTSDNVALKENEEKLTNLKKALDDARNDFAAADAKRIGCQKQINELSEKLDRQRRDSDSFAEKKHSCEMNLSRNEGELKSMTDRIWDDYGLTYAGAGEFRKEDFKLSESEKRIGQLKSRIKAMGNVNVGAVDEYRTVQERFDELTTQRDDLTKAELDLMGIIDDITGSMEKQFTKQFAQLNEYFKETFVNLFGGGKAELRLADSKDPLNCGIDVIAQPPGKKLQLLTLLSGGERALTAIAIMFAMLKLKPTPFCFLDEIEAALDDANIDSFAEYLHTFSKDTQFIVITHRKGTMERCDSLYGVAMEEKGVSRLVSVRLSEITGEK